MRKSLRIKPASFVALLCIGCLVGIAPYLEYIGYNARFLLLSSYALLLGALIFSATTGGIFSYRFWFTLVAAYPLLTPLLVQDLLGYEYFSYFARWMQEDEILAAPIFVGSLATLFLACAIRARTLQLRPALASPPTIDPRAAKWLLLSACLGMVFFAWLAEPGGIIGVVDNTTKREQRFSGVRFAGGAWLVFVVLGTAMFLRFTGTRAALYRGLYWAALTISLTWLFLHARRSEPLGVIIFLFCLVPFRGRVPDSLWLSLVTRRTLMLLLVGILFSAIGYFRGNLDWSSLQRDDYIATPGGGSANFLTFLAVYVYREMGVLTFSPGETYLNLLVNIPPEAFGLPRAPDTYALLSAHVDLMGGENWLMEPFMNGGNVGVAIFCLVLIFLVNRSVYAVRRYATGRANVLQFLLGGAFLACMFRTMWYGPETVVNAAIIATIIGGTIVSGQVLARRVSGRRNVDRPVPSRGRGLKLVED